MRNDLELDAIIEDYLLGKLNAAEHEAFEQLRKNDARIDHKVVTHKVFLQTMEEYAEELQLRAQLDAIHAEIDVEALADKLRPHPSRIVQFWRRNKAVVGIAASFIVLSLVSIYSIQHSSKQEDRYEQLNREISKVKKTQTNQNNLVLDLKSKVNNAPVQNSNPGAYGGTGFAVSSNGYIVTNLHVITDGDSILVQDNEGKSYKVKVVHKDPEYDMAILKIIDKRFKGLSSLPYTIKKSNTGIGENVYTLGYPKDEVVFTQGYVSSKNGFVGDTTQYQVAIPVNRGNSGGPLLDNSGNLVGIISGKESNADGATFAIKSKYIIEAMRAIPQDSLGKKIIANRKSSLTGLKRTKQIEKLQDYVFMIKVY
ncbi:trypsin-like peptidase domain-containing protein [Pedobacter sp. MW01-1-1]|uniref:trypsin-like peptidase domain-containing protein n=1 Tax=Pedobacter sp. MW01-1-1 TaxID=3383027 RepID=UPI003FF14E1E